MEEYTEKRKYERYAYDTPLYLYTSDAKDRYYNANMADYSGGGMSLRTDERIEVGQQVYIKTKYYDEEASGPEKYAEYVGYVMWSDELGTSIPGGQYGYGIKYADPVYY